MRKLLAVAVGLVCVLNANAADIEQPFMDRVILYVPNRAMDFMDMFSLNLGFGPKAKIGVRATRALNFEAGIGISADAVKDYNRQYGGSMTNGWQAGGFWMGAEETKVSMASRGVQKYHHYAAGVPSASEAIYDEFIGARDFWEVAVEAAALVNIRAALHPFEIADFVTGIFFYDLKGDDLTMERVTD